MSRECEVYKQQLHSRNMAYIVVGVKVKKYQTRN